MIIFSFLIAKTSLFALKQFRTCEKSFMPSPINLITSGMPAHLSRKHFESLLTGNSLMILLNPCMPKLESIRRYSHLEITSSPTVDSCIWYYLSATEFHRIKWFFVNRCDGKAKLRYWTISSNTLIFFFFSLKLWNNYI